jgi:hypothetical protein
LIIYVNKENQERIPTYSKPESTDLLRKTQQEMKLKQQAKGFINMLRSFNFITGGDHGKPLETFKQEMNKLYFSAVLGLELGTSHLLGRQSTT